MTDVSALTALGASATLIVFDLRIRVNEKLSFLLHLPLRLESTLL